MHFKSFLSGAAVVALIGLNTHLAFAEDSDDIDALAHSLEKQGKKLQAEEKALLAQQRKLEKEQAEFESLRAKIEHLSGKRIRVADNTPPDDESASSSPPPQSASPTSHGSTPTPEAVPTPDEVGTDRKPATPEKPPEVAKYIEEGGVLLPKGQLVLTPSLEYDRLSSTNVAVEGFSIIPALNIGSFEISQANQNVLMAAMDARLGITNRFEVEAKVPYVYGDQYTTGRAVGAGSSEDTVNSIDGNGIGDVEFGAHYQMNSGKNDWPYLIANLRFKTETGEGPFEISTNSFGLESKLPTGSGFYALQPSITAIYPADPVVFYSNIGYTHNFERSFPVYGTIDPGDSVNASFGMSTSLNDATSLSIGYSHSMVFDTQQNGQNLPGSQYLQVGSLDFGWSYILNKRVSLNLNVSAGVTSDAPSDRVIFRVPIAFDAF